MGSHASVWFCFGQYLVLINENWQHRKYVRGCKYNKACWLDELGAKGDITRKEGMTEKRNCTSCMCFSCECSLEEWPHTQALGKTSTFWWRKECACVLDTLARAANGPYLLKLWPDPTVLHVKEKAITYLKKSKELLVIEVLVSQGTFGHTGTRKDNCVLSVLPIKVKSSKGDNDTYLCFF